MRFILASKSPRRRELLSSLALKMGFGFEIIALDVDESLEKSVTPKDSVRILAERKGRAVAEMEGFTSLIISSDTLVELDGVSLGKPLDREDAIRMLRSLSGRSHFVHTGVSVSYKGRVFSEVASTEVVFYPLSEEDILSYVESGEPMDKAGAYAIQGGAGKFVKEYIGDFDTVVGLSLSLTESLIREALGGEALD